MEYVLIAVVAVDVVIQMFASTGVIVLYLKFDLNVLCKLVSTHKLIDCLGSESGSDFGEFVQFVCRP